MEDYFIKENTIFEDKQTLLLDYNDWGILIDDFNTLMLYDNFVCLQKYNNHLYYILELMKQNDYTHFSEKNARYIDAYMILIYDLYKTCNNYLMDQSKRFLPKRSCINFICPFDKYNEYIIIDEIKLYEHLLYLTHLNNIHDILSLKSYYSILKYVDYCLDILNIEKQNISNYNYFYKILTEKYNNYYNIVVKNKIFMNIHITKFVNYFDNDTNIYDILIYIVDIYHHQNINEINNIKQYYLTQLKTEDKKFIYRYEQIIKSCELCINKINNIDDFMDD